MQTATHLLRLPSWQILATLADLTNQRQTTPQTCGDLGVSESVLEARAMELQALVGRTYGL